MKPCVWTVILRGMLVGLLAPSPAQAGTGEGTYLSFVLDTMGYIPSQVTIAPSQSWNAASKTFSLSATARDNQGAAVTVAQSFSWALRNPAGSQQLATGSMSWNAGTGQWRATQTLDAGLAPGSYSVFYSIITSNGRTGSAAGPLAIAGLLTLSGRVLDGDRQPLGGVTVSAGGQNTPTDGQGRYVLTSINAANLTTLTGSKPGFATYTAPLQPPASGSLIVHDFNMYPTVGNAPVVTGVKGKYRGYFLKDVSFDNPYTATVDWAGGTPKELRISVNGKLKKTVPASASTVGFSMNPGLDFPGKPLGFESTMEVVAVNGQNIASEPLRLPVSVIGIALGFESVFFNAGEWIYGSTPEDLVWHFKFEWPPSGGEAARKVALPFVGQLGGGMSLTGEGEYKVRTGEWEIAVGKKIEKVDWHLPGAKPKYARFKISALEIDTTYEGFVKGLLEQGKKLELKEFGLQGGLDTRARFLEFYFTDYIPLLGPAIRTIAALGVPGLNDVWSLVRANAYVTLDTGLEAVFGWNPLQFKSLNWPVDPGIEAAYEPKVSDILSGKLYAGGQFGWTTDIVPEFGLRDLRGKVYGGAEFTVWVFGFGPYEAVFVQYPTEAGPSLTGEAPGFRWVTANSKDAATMPRIHPFDRSYRKNGEQQFVAYQPAGVQTQSNAPALSPLEAFRAMGKPIGVRATLYSGAKGPVRSQADLPLIQNVFPYSEPALAANGSQLMLAYVSDNGAQGDLSFTDINWTRFDGANWTTPAPIQADTRAEFAPMAAFDGDGDAVALWERVKDPNFNQVDLRAMAAQMEIVGARWDHATGQWGTPATLTDNAQLDHAPLVCGPMSDGSLLGTWTTNPANLLMGTGADGVTSNSQVLWTKWDKSSHAWPAAQPLVNNLTYRLSQSLAGVGNKAVYAWTRDLNGDPSTMGDQEVFYCLWNGSAWGAPARLTNDTVADRNIRAAVSTDGHVYLVWQRGEDLVMDIDLANSPSVIRPDSQTVAFADYSMTLGPAGNLVLVWQEMSESGSDAHYAIYDPVAGRWSRDARLFEDAPLERSFAPDWDSAGNLTLAYNRVEIELTTKTVTLDGGETVKVPGVPTPGRVDLGVLKRTLIKDLAIQVGDLTAQAGNWLPGSPVTLTARVRNTGNLPFENPVVAFYKGDPAGGGEEFARETIPGWLDGATSTTVRTTWIVPETEANQALYAMVDPDQTISESDRENNVQSLGVSGADLKVQLNDVVLGNDHSARVIVNVRNAGAPGAPASLLAIRYKDETGTALVTAQIPALEPGIEAQVALDLPSGTVPGGETLFTVSADDEQTVTEADRNNNTMNFAVLNPQNSVGAIWRLLE